jgi:hypothetical protein
MDRAYWGDKKYNFNHQRSVNMQRFLFILVICLVGIIYINFDSIVEKVNDFKTPTFDIAVEESSLGADGDLTLKIILKNVADSPVFVRELGITYIVFPDENNYDYKNRDIEVRQTIDKINPLDITVILPDYFNLKVEPAASLWIRNKRKNFGIKISVKDNFEETIQWTKIKLDPLK